MPGSHHQHEKRKGPVLTRSATIADIVTVNPQDNTVIPEFPLVAFIWPTRGTTSQWVLIPLILMAVGLFRWAVGLWGYSGFEKPPMHGDFEAHRHWMEITTHLPITLWYFYDLQYWGLDYPPLTAYHSWLCGKIGILFNPDWFMLDTSRGIEQPLLKLFMRSTVLISEYLVYVPAVITFLRHYGRNQGVGATCTAIALVAILMQPATMIIDHGHFQYNTVMLGFMVASMSSMYAGRLLWSCVFFVAALGFKQMALYYSPIVFAFLLGSCLKPPLRLSLLLAIAGITILSFVILSAPLLVGALLDSDHSVSLPNPFPSALLVQLPSGFETSPLGRILIQLFQCIHRCFPFARGLFEDKVANFWCALNTVVKLRRLDTLIPLPRLSLLATLASIMPSALIVGISPRKSLLPYALASSAWGFFLFSFQVHEKSVLLPLLPMTLLLGSKKGLSKEYRAWIGWANMLGMWTMFPLLKRDELQTPYFVLSLLWAFLLGLPPTSISAYYHEDVPGQLLDSDELWTPTKILHLQYYILMACWHLLAAFATPPEDKPHLWEVINACLGAAGFGICYLWCTWKLVEESGLSHYLFGAGKASSRASAKGAGRKVSKTTHGKNKKNR